ETRPGIVGDQAAYVGFAPYRPVKPDIAQRQPRPVFQDSLDQRRAIDPPIRLAQRAAACPQPRPPPPPPLPDLFPTPHLFLADRPPSRLQRDRRPDQVLVGEIPIDEMLKEGSDVVRATILVVEIIGMLPHVDREERYLPVRDRRIRIGRLGYA